MQVLIKEPKTVRPSGSAPTPVSCPAAVRSRFCSCQASSFWYFRDVARESLPSVGCPRQGAFSRFQSSPPFATAFGRLAKNPIRLSYDTSLMPRRAPRLRMTTLLTGGLLSLAGHGVHSSQSEVRESPVYLQRSPGRGSRMNSGLRGRRFSAGATYAPCTEWKSAVVVLTRGTMLSPRYTRKAIKARSPKRLVTSRKFGCSPPNYSGCFILKCANAPSAVILNRISLALLSAAKTPSALL